MNIAIIVPFFNRQKYLFETLSSIKNQSYERFQVVLVDDASEDSSFEIAKAFVDEDSRFVLIKNTQKQRQGKAKNKGIDYILGIQNRGGAARI